MTVFETIKNRHSIRKYKDIPVEREKLEKTRQALAENEKALNLPEQYLEALIKCRNERDILMAKAKKKSLVAN